MTKDIDDESLLLTVDRLREVFRDSHDNTPQMVQAVKQIIGDVNITDTSEREGSSWRDRPLHMILKEAQQPPRPALRKLEAGAKTDWSKFKR